MSTSPSSLRPDDTLPAAPGSAIRAREARSDVPVLRREAIIPVVPPNWLWSYLAIKAALITCALATMAAIAR